MRHAFIVAIFIAGLLPDTGLSDLATLQSRQRKLDAALKKVGPALVSVQDGFGAGSGVVVSEDGIVLTASHVVETHRQRQMRLRVVFPDGSKYRAELLGMNRNADAAMLKISEPYRSGSKFPHVTLGESKDLKRGEWCFALGHPGGFRASRPAPVRLGRVLSVGHRTIVSDCAIVLGDSGGPLFDLSGKLIGIHSMITEVIVENRHVAIDVFRRDGDRMEDKQLWGTLQSRDNDIAESDFFGVRLRWRSFTPEVTQVIKGSPADDAGIRQGDILVRVNNQQFADGLGLSTLLSQVAEDQRIKVTYDRVGSKRTVYLTTGRKPSEAELRVRKDREISQEHYRELKNQLTSARKVGPYEKRSIEELDRFRPLLNSARDSVVEFREFGEVLTLGTIMSSDGYILTKASELEDAIDPECILSSGRRFKIREVAVDAAFDLMLVRIAAKNLKPVKWSTAADPKAGRILMTTDSRGTPLLPGVVSVANRKLATAKKGFLGVVLEQGRSSRRVRIAKLLPGGAAERSGIKSGDIVLSINGRNVTNVPDMSNHVSSLAPNSKVAIRVERENVVKTIDVILTPRFVAERNEVMLSRYSDTENIGKFASAHNSGFPEAIQHDTDLFPEQCGGPVYDISGTAIGLNIARSARIASYAIPAKAVMKVFNELKSKGRAK